MEGNMSEGQTMEGQVVEGEMSEGHTNDIRLMRISPLVHFFWHWELH